MKKHYNYLGGGSSGRRTGNGLIGWPTRTTHTHYNGDANQEVRPLHYSLVGGMKERVETQQSNLKDFNYALLLIK